MAREFELNLAATVWRDGEASILSDEERPANGIVSQVPRKAEWLGVQTAQRSNELAPVVVPTASRRHARAESRPGRDPRFTRQHQLRRQSWQFILPESPRSLGNIVMAAAAAWPTTPSGGELACSHARSHGRTRLGGLRRRGTRHSPCRGRNLNGAAFTVAAELTVKETRA